MKRRYPPPRNGHPAFELGPIKQRFPEKEREPIVPAEIHAWAKAKVKLIEELAKPLGWKLPELYFSDSKGGPFGLVYFLDQHQSIGPVSADGIEILDDDPRATTLVFRPWNRAKWMLYEQFQKRLAEVTA